MKKKLAMIGGLAVCALLIFVAAGSASDGPGGPWADKVVDFQQGPTKTGAPVPADRSDASQALGEAEMSGAQGTFVSLGFGGSITLEFENLILNGPGEDIEVWEVTWGSYPEEKVKVKVSQDNVNYYIAGYASNVGSSSNVRLTKIAMPASLAWAKYVKLIDDSCASSFPANGDGFDLTGVKAIHSMVNVDIDVKPGSWPNSINLKAKGNVPVAVFGSATVDVSSINRDTVKFACAPALEIGKSPQDINCDGYLDQVFHFDVEQLCFTTDSVVGELTGEFDNGTPFSGMDAVRIVK